MPRQSASSSWSQVRKQIGSSTRARYRPMFWDFRTQLWDNRKQKHVTHLLPKEISEAGIYKPTVAYLDFKMKLLYPHKPKTHAGYLRMVQEREQLASRMKTVGVLD